MGGATYGSSGANGFATLGTHTTTMTYGALFEYITTKR
eukprot:SAG25_NODE_14912_length_199_cov_89.610000_1_plen_37_part_01